MVIRKKPLILLVRVAESATGFFTAPGEALLWS